MLETHHYRDIAYAVTDEAPQGVPGCLYLLYGTGQAWHVYSVFDEATLCLLTAGAPLPSRKEAVRDVHARIDQDFLSLEAERPSLQFEPRVVDHTLRQAQERGGHRIGAPARTCVVALDLALLIRLHNALPRLDPLRAEMQARLSALAAKHGELAGLLRDEAGDLHYDDVRARQNMHRHEAERRAQDLLIELRKVAEQLQSVHLDQAEASQLEAPLTPGHIPLVEVSATSHTVMGLTTANTRVLQALSALSQGAFHDQFRDSLHVLAMEDGAGAPPALVGHGASLSSRSPDGGRP